MARVRDEEESTTSLLRPLTAAAPYRPVILGRKVVLTMELLDNNAASLTDNRLAPLKSVYFGSNEGRGPVPSVQP